MPDASEPILSAAHLAGREDFNVGDLSVSPSRRTLRGPSASVSLEPRVIQVLTVLAEASGSLVTRERLFDRCWSGLTVGEDSLNRVIAVLRKAIQDSGARQAQIRTVSATGYVLETRISAAVDVDEAIRAGYDSWRLNLPMPDWKRIDQLRQAVLAQPANAKAWATLALLLRIAAEYAEPDACTAAVLECHASADRALALDPSQTTARTALVSVGPLFGDWTSARKRLLAIRELDAENAPAKHDLAVLEMATGRPSAAVPMIAELIEADPLAALYHYKRTYHLWTLGQHGEMDRVSDRAQQLWPRHPAIWHARLWSLAFTGRAKAALAQIEDAGSRPDLPPPALTLLHATISAVAEGLSPGDPKRSAAIAQNIAAASRGPSQSVAAIIHLCGLGELDAAFDVANAYLARRGPLVVPLHHAPAAEGSVNEQHRRVTQMLFLPVSAEFRADPRFLDLCQAMGMADYWRDAGITPDFLAEPTSPRP